jgi:hypothetical protein
VRSRGSAPARVLISAHQALHSTLSYAAACAAIKGLCSPVASSNLPRSMIYVSAHRYVEDILDTRRAGLTLLCVLTLTHALLSSSVPQFSPRGPRPSSPSTSVRHSPIVVCAWPDSHADTDRSVAVSSALLGVLGTLIVRQVLTPR